MSKNKLVWSDEEGDLRNKKEKVPSFVVDEASLTLNLKRLTSGKGRTVVEISALPRDVNWCKDLAKSLKKALAVGGTFKNNCIEIHGEKIDLVTKVLDQKNIKWKKTGG